MKKHSVSLIAAMVLAVSTLFSCKQSPAHNILIGDHPLKKINNNGYFAFSHLSGNQLTGRTQVKFYWLSNDQKTYIESTVDYAKISVRFKEDQTVPTATYRWMPYSGPSKRPSVNELMSDNVDKVVITIKTDDWPVEKTIGSKLVVQ